MVTFLLIVSFIIHIITIYTIIDLFRRNETLDQETSSQLKSMFNTYMNEIKAENQKLQMYIENQQARNVVPIEKSTTKEPILDILDKDPLMNSDVHVDQLETSLKANVLSLAEKGYNVENIAKQLQCGKTEAQLILKIHRKV